MTNIKHNINVHIVKDSKPVGRAFKRKKSSGKLVNVDFKNKSKDNIVKEKLHDKVKNSTELGTIPEADRITQPKSKPDKSSVLRPISQLQGNISQNTGIKRKLPTDSCLSHKRNKLANLLEKCDQDKSESTTTKKSRRKKKKKKKTGDEASDSTGYKPIIVVKGPQGISANWKNLKDIITRADKDKPKDITKGDKPKAKDDREKAKKEITKNVKDSSVSDKKFKTNKANKNTTAKTLGKDRDNSNNKKLKTTSNESLIKKKLKLEKKNSKKKKMQEEIWFDNVDPTLLGEEYAEQESSSEEEGEEETKTPSNSKAVGIDCEMVGIGHDGQESMLARVSIVDQYCNTIYDKYVKPREHVVDYRTEFSGIRPEDIKDGEDFLKVQSEVEKILSGKILVGHGLFNDLRCLGLSHPRNRIRDTARHKPFRKMFGGYIPKLKMLTKKVIGAEIQTGEHDSVQDAAAAMRVYLAYRKEWETKKKKVYVRSSKKKANNEELALLTEIKA